MARRRAQRHAAHAGVARQAVACESRRGARRPAGEPYMSAVTITAPRTFAYSRVAGVFLLATLFCVTFEKLHWNVAGELAIADVTTVLFLLAFALTSRGPLPRTTAIVLGFFAAFLLVYLLGFFNLETKQAFDQFTKGMVKYVLHFLFLIAAITYLVRRGQRYYWH